MKGEYKVPGAKELAEKLQLIPIIYQLSTVWDILMGHRCMAMRFYQYGLKLVLVSAIDGNNNNNITTNVKKDLVVFELLYIFLVRIFESNCNVWATRHIYFPFLIWVGNHLPTLTRDVHCLYNRKVLVFDLVSYVWKYQLSILSIP